MFPWFCRLCSAHPNPELMLNGTLIPVVEQTKFLGVIVDNKLTFLPHIRYLKEKCMKALNLLRVVAHNFRATDQQTLSHLYRLWHRNEFERGGAPVQSKSGELFFGRAPSHFGFKRTISRFGERFREGQYSLVSFLFAVLLLTVPPRTQPFLKLRGARAPLPHGVGAVDHCLSEILNFLFGCNSSQQECT